LARLLFKRVYAPYNAAYFANKRITIQPSLDYAIIKHLRCHFKYLLAIFWRFNPARILENETMLIDEADHRVNQSIKAI
jgi:hypothetical protein